MHSKSPGSNLSTFYGALDDTVFPLHFCTEIMSVHILPCGVSWSARACKLWSRMHIPRIAIWEAAAAGNGMHSRTQLQIISSHANFWSLALCLPSALIRSERLQLRRDLTFERRYGSWSGILFCLCATCAHCRGFNFLHNFAHYLRVHSGTIEPEVSTPKT